MIDCECRHGGIKCGRPATHSLGGLRRQSSIDPLPLCLDCAHEAIPGALEHQSFPYTELWVSSGTDGYEPWPPFDQAYARMLASPERAVWETERPNLPKPAPEI